MNINARVKMTFSNGDQITTQLQNVGLELMSQELCNRELNTPITLVKIEEAN